MSFFRRRRAPSASGYSDAGASSAKRALKGFQARSSVPSEDIDFNNATLRQRGRMLYMASPIASAAVNTSRTKIVGPGLHMKCAINRKILGLKEEAIKEWQDKTEAEWKLWAEKKENCDALGINNFYGIQQLAVKSWLMSGDTFALIKREKATALNPYTLRIHLIEADRICTPHTMKSYTVTEGVNPKNGNKIHDGVEVNKQGKIVAYHICSAYPQQAILDTAKWQRIEAVNSIGLANILQVMDSERPDQYRGVTYLASDIETLLQLRRYTESELMAALVQSFLTAWVTTESDTTENPLNEVNPTDEDGNEDSVSEDENEYEMGPGVINHLRPGENVTLGNPNIPTAGFETFTKTIIKMVGASLELPYDVLLKEFNSSYSAAKGALEEAREAIMMRRTWLIDDLCQPVYEMWLAEAVATGRVKAPGFFTDPLIRAAWSAARWDGPAQIHLDPVKEANANEIQVRNGWKTNAQVTRESYGGDWDDNADIVLREAEKFAAKMISYFSNQKGDNGNAGNTD